MQPMSRCNTHTAVHQSNETASFKSARAPRNQASVVSILANTAMSGIDAANKDENPAVEVMGLLPPHEQMLDIATYGPVLIAKEECERNYAGEVVVLDDRVDAQVVELLGPVTNFSVRQSLPYLVCS